MSPGVHSGGWNRTSSSASTQSFLPASSPCKPTAEIDFTGSPAPPLDVGCSGCSRGWLFQPGAQPIVNRLLCALRVRGGHLWADGPDGARIFLDGDTTANTSRASRLRICQVAMVGPAEALLSRSGSLPPMCRSPRCVFSASVNLNVVSGTVSRGGEGVEAATVRLRRNSSPGVGSEQRTRSDAEGQFSFTALEGDYTVIAESLGDTAEQNVDVGPVIVRPPTPPVGPGDLTVGEIDGIGPVFSGQLTAGGVRLVREFVLLPPQRIAEILSISVERARNLLVNARRLLEE